MLKTARTLVLLALAGACVLAGDLTITFKNSGKFNQGSSTQYYSADFHRTNQDGSRTDTLVDFKNGTFYTIKHKDKLIEKMSFDDMAAAAEAMGKKMAEMKESMAAMPAFLRNKMGGDPDAFSVDETGKEVVAGRNCKGYRITVGSLAMELANDPSLQIPVNPAHWARFSRLRGLTMGAAGAMAGSYARLYEEMGKLKGLTLKSKSSFPFIGEVVSEATEVQQGPIAAAVFQLPQGYKMEDAGKKLLNELSKGR